LNLSVWLWFAPFPPFRILTVTYKVWWVGFFAACLGLPAPHPFFLRFQLGRIISCKLHGLSEFLISLFQLCSLRNL
jgi:hypothetical protein